MRGAVLALLALCAGPATAQVVYPPAVAADVRSADVTLDSSGNAVWDFTDGGKQSPFGGVPDITHMPKAMDTANAVICNFTSVTASATTIHCWRTTTIGLLNNLLGGSVSGAVVHLIARYRAP